MPLLPKLLPQLSARLTSALSVLPARASACLCGITLATACHSPTLQTPTPSAAAVARADTQVFPDQRYNTADAAPVFSQFNASNTVSGSWIDDIHPLYDHARKLVEQELNVDLSHIRLLIVDDDPITAEVSRETRRLVTEQFGHSNFSEQFLSRVMQAQAGTYAALFTSRLKAIMVSRKMLANYERSLPNDPVIQSAALTTLLIHELVHAADDQRYQIHAKRALNFRASFAQSATFEGHAQWVTRRICAQNGCSIGLQALDNFMFSRNDNPKHLTQPVEAISRNVLEYSYVEGERFITSLAERKGGDRLIEQLLTAPPYDPIQILSPASFPDIDREKRNQRLINASLNIDHTWVNGPWIGVETSPLKGVDLRADPSRRQAAVDGFTRLIQGMVAMQLYDRSNPQANPLEVTLLHAESANTARLFARTLHENAQLADAVFDEEPLLIDTGAGHQQTPMRMHVFRTAIDSEVPYRTAIGLSGPYVVQIAGAAEVVEQMDDYAIRVLLNLQLNP